MQEFLPKNKVLQSVSFALVLGDLEYIAATFKYRIVPGQHDVVDRGLSDKASGRESRLLYGWAL